MTLDELLDALTTSGLDQLIFPPRLLGAFRRKSITFCNGLTDETTQVYWFQSKSFTIDLRLPDGAATPLPFRQGWVGDTHWDDAQQQMSWTVNRSYQPRNQWPEPANLAVIGSCILETAPSGAYVEDWRQQSSRGPLLGLRLFEMICEPSGKFQGMDGGLIIAGEHAAYAQSRAPHVDDALRSANSLAEALAEGVVTEAEVESYEVSVAIGGRAITHSTQRAAVGQPILKGDFTIGSDGIVELSRSVGGVPCQLRFALDFHVPDFSFERRTAVTAGALAWLEHEQAHLMRHARIVR